MLGDAGCRHQPGTGSSFSPWPRGRSDPLAHPGGGCLNWRKHGDAQSCSALYLSATRGSASPLCQTPERLQADLLLEAKSRLPSSWRKARISPRPAGLPGAISYHISISVSPWLCCVNTFRQWKDLHLQRKDCWIAVLRKRPAPVWSEGNHPAVVLKLVQQIVTPSPPRRGCGCWNGQHWEQRETKMLKTLP